MPGTKFDLTCSQFSQTKKGRENSMFQCNKIILEDCVHKLLLNRYRVISVRMSVGEALLHLT